MCSNEKISHSIYQLSLPRSSDESMLKTGKNGERSLRTTCVRTCPKCSHTDSLKQCSRYSRIFSVSPTCICQVRRKSSTLFNVKPSRATTLAIMIIALTSLSSGSSLKKSECHPSDPNSCKYGATCQKEEGRSRQGEPFYRCVCPRVDCFKAGLFDPVCGVRSGYKEQYYNVLCLMLEECALQQPIRQACYGMCGQESCRAVTSENQHHAPCPRKDVALCQNGGLCVHHTILKESSCRCASGFEGNRCETKLLPVEKLPGDEGSNCDSKRQLLTIFAIVLFVLILVLLVVCMCWRRSGGKKNDDDASLLDSKATEKDETTPLRESKRSDYLFPESERKNSSN